MTAGTWAEWSPEHRVLGSLDRPAVLVPQMPICSFSKGYYSNTLFTQSFIHPMSSELLLCARYRTTC